MEGRRRQKWDNYKRSQQKRPPRGNCSWQPTVPSWEKDFCREIGSMDWETLLQMKKFTHLYENVIKWDDSAGEEAFSSAKNRFWDEINGLPSSKSLPDPDLYIDKIDWNSKSDPDLESEPLNSNADEDHDPVIIFGNSLFPNQESYSATGWGDDDENFKVPANSSSGNHGAPLMQNWDHSFDNGTKAAIGWPRINNDAWQFGDGNMAQGGGWNNNSGWTNSDNVQNDAGLTMGDQEQGKWNEVNAGRKVSNGMMPRMQGKESYKNRGKGGQKARCWGEESGLDKRTNSREWNSFGSCARTVGQTWNQQKPIR